MNPWDERGFVVGDRVHEHADTGDWVKDSRCNCEGAYHWVVVSLDRVGIIDPPSGGKAGRSWFMVVPLVFHGMVTL